MAKKKNNDNEKELVNFIGEEISMESALIASAFTLISAKKMAEGNQDIDSLIRIASAWYDIAKFLYSDPEEEIGKTTHFGFTALETVDDPGDEPDKGESGIEIRSKSRKLRKHTP